MPSKQRTFGDEVTYSRPGQPDIVKLKMVLTEDSSTFEEVGGAFIPIKKLFGLVKKVDIDFDSGPVDPARGDKVTTASGNIYKVEGDSPAENIRDTEEWKLSLSKTG